MVLKGDAKVYTDGIIHTPEGKLTEPPPSTALVLPVLSYVSYFWSDCVVVSATITS